MIEKDAPWDRLVRRGQRAAIASDVVSAVLASAGIAGAVATVGVAGWAIGALIVAVVYVSRRRFHSFLGREFAITAMTAWYEGVFASDVDLALEALDVDYLIEIAHKYPGRTDLVSTAVVARFPALSGDEIPMRIVRAADDSRTLGPTAGSRASDRFPDVFAANTASRASRSTTSRLRGARVLLAGLAAGGPLVSIAVIVAVASRGVAEFVPLFVAGLALSLGVAAFVYHDRIVAPALVVADYREKYDSSPERVFEEWGRSLPAGLVLPAPGEPVISAVSPLRRAFPWLPLWDAVAIVRLARDSHATPV